MADSRLWKKRFIRAARGTLSSVSWRQKRRRGYARSFCRRTARAVDDITGNGETYDLVFDVVGKTSRSRWKSSLKKGGAYISVMSSARLLAGDLAFLKELIETGKLRPFIDRRYPLEQMAEAHRYVETGQKKGSVVITAGHDDEKRVRDGTEGH